MNEQLRASEAETSQLKSLVARMEVAHAETASKVEAGQTRLDEAQAAQRAEAESRSQCTAAMAAFLLTTTLPGSLLTTTLPSSAWAGSAWAEAGDPSPFGHQLREKFNIFRCCIRSEFRTNNFVVSF